MNKFTIAFLVCIASCTSMCTDSERSESVLHKAGYKNVSITGWSRGCSDDDTYCTGFKATGPSGDYVEGSVGCGYNNGCSKGCTIRIE